MEGSGKAVCSPEITHGSVEAALRADKGAAADLQSFGVYEYTNRGDNYACTIHKVDAKYTLGGVEQKASYVVKYRPKFTAELEAFIYIAFQKEQTIYQKVFPEIQSHLKAIGMKPLGVPRCYYASFEKGREVTFMEDLRALGFQMADRRIGLDVAHTRLVLEELAKLHAASHLLKAQVTDFSKKYPDLNVDWTNYADDAKQKTQKMFFDLMNSTSIVLKEIKGYEKVSDWLARNKDSAADLLEKELERIPPFDMLCHGDCWTNNVLFRYNDEGLPVEVMLVDFQMFRLASFATDLTYFLQASLEGDVRKASLDLLLDSYYSQFSTVTEAGKQPMPFSRQQLQEEYRNRLHFSLIMSTFANLVMISEGQIDEDNFTDSMTEVLKRLKSTEIFRTRFLSVFDDMIENKIIT